MTRRARLPLLAVLLAAAACSSKKDDDTSSGDSGPPGPEAQKAAIDAEVRFACALAEDRRSQSQTFAVSPVALWSAGGMAAGGARGKTAKELEAANLPVAAVRAGYPSLLDALNRTAEVHVANAAWVNSKGDLQTGFTSPLRSTFKAQYKEADFDRDRDAVASQVAKWARDESRIASGELFPRYAMPYSGRAVVATVVAVNAPWPSPLVPVTDEQRNTYFDSSGGRAFGVTMLAGPAKVKRLKGDGFEAGDIPLHGAQVSLVVFVPNQPGGLPELARKLTPDNLAKWAGEKWEEQEVELVVPRFKLEPYAGSSGALHKMGVKDAFSSDKADYSGALSSEDYKLYLTLPASKTSFQVNETGVTGGQFESAALDAMYVGRGRGTTTKASVGMAPPTPPAPPPPPPGSGPGSQPVNRFAVSRPFVFVVRHNPTGTVLFVGQVNNPQGW